MSLDHRSTTKTNPQIKPCGIPGKIIKDFIVDPCTVDSMDILYGKSQTKR